MTTQSTHPEIHTLLPVISSPSNTIRGGSGSPPAPSPSPFSGSGVAYSGTCEAFLRMPRMRSESGRLLAQSSRRNVMIVDESKLSPMLGTHCPVPVEVIPFAWKPVANYLRSLGAEPVLRMNEDGAPYATDQNNYIIDCGFGPIPDLEDLAVKLGQKAGIAGYGLFIGTASEIIVATSHGIRYQKRKDS